MKNLLKTLLLFPLLVLGQNIDSCYSIDNYNVLLLEANPKLSIDLPEGWSMFGFSCSDSIDAITAFEDHKDKITIVKDEMGLSYLPAWEFNALGRLKPSEGYQIKMNTAVSGVSFCERLSLPQVLGCVDCEAINFDSWATTSDGSCHYDSDGDGVYDADEIGGCQSIEACNYNPDATDDNDSCTYPSETYLNCSGTCLSDSDSDGVCDEIELEGCQSVEACNYNPDATDADDSCSYPSVVYLDCSGFCLNDTDDDGVCDEVEVEGCVNPDACNYDTEATEDDGFCTYPSESHLDCAGACLNDSDDDGVCDEFEIAGCLDVAACNYNVQATDAGACSFAQDGYDCDGNLLIQVGLEYAGGIIFYIDPNSPEHGLVVSKEDIGTPIQWGCNSKLIGADETGLGSWAGGEWAANSYYSNGRYYFWVKNMYRMWYYGCNDDPLEWNNTLKGIKTFLNLFNASTDAGGHTDWFIPTKDQLKEIYDVRDQLVDSPGFVECTSNYWSSSESSNNKAWLQRFGDGLLFEYWKDQPVGKVRAVRAF